MAKLHKRWRYNDAAALIDIPLTVDEANDLVANFDKSFLKDESQVEHFALRVVATCRQARELRSNIEQEISRRTMHMPAGGSTPTLSPQAAVRFLTDEQIEELFDPMRRQQLEMMRSAQAQAEADSVVHNAAIAALENLAADISVNPSVDASVRERIVQALHEARQAASRRPDSSGGTTP